MNISLSENDFFDLLSAIARLSKGTTERARMEELTWRIFKSVKQCECRERNTELGKCGCNCIDNNTQQDILQNGFTSRCDMEIGPCACGAWHGSGKAKEVEALSANAQKKILTRIAPNGIVRSIKCSLYEQKAYWVYVRSQDGIEYAGEYDNLTDARTGWAEASRAFGNSQAKEFDAKLYEEKNGEYFLVKE
jgi:hypothetical protein